MFIVHLTNCVDNVDDEKRTPAEKKDSHNDAHLLNRLVMKIMKKLHMVTMITAIMLFHSMCQLQMMVMIIQILRL